MIKTTATDSRERDQTKKGDTFATEAKRRSLRLMPRYFG